ncbi:MAG: alpha/beta hydrolase-fold protein [Chloroflexota bacterium]|nr:alpha/beta hydrolase-fold protein [Chloroflexota bacterium]
MTRRQDSHPLKMRILPLFFALGWMLGACNPAPDPEMTPHPQPTATTVAVTPTANTSLPSPTQPAPTGTPDCLQIGGEVQSFEFYSTQLGGDLIFDVYLPPCYDPDAGPRYPVTYLLHGLSYAQDQWQRLGVVRSLDRLIAGGELAPFIVVMPLEAAFEPPQTSQFGDAIVQDLIPWVDKNLHTIADSDHRAIGGVSRGAAWATRLGFESYELFTRVGAHSLPLFEADGGRLIAWTTQLPKDELPQFFIDIGRNDQEWKTAQTFADLLDENSIPHEWYLFNGGHTEAYWSTHLEQYLRWYAWNW